MPPLLPSHHRLINQILAAYREGWFPMADPSTKTVEWVQPNRRAIIPLNRDNTLRLSRSLRAKLRRPHFLLTTDTAFEHVIRACAAPSPLPGRDSTWLDPAIIDAFQLLHHAGHAHSIEVWTSPPLPGFAGRGARVREGGEGLLTSPAHLHSAPSSASANSSAFQATPAPFTLVGGLYGLALGSAFMGESMFCLPHSGGTDASKVALVHLVHHLRRQGFTLLDSQIQNPHMRSLGAIEIPRATYLKRLTTAALQPRPWLPFQPDLTITTLSQPTK